VKEARLLIMTTQKLRTIRPPHWERLRPEKREGGREGGKKEE
jgi:hypothetical protein